MKFYGILIKPLLQILVWLLVGATGRWTGCAPEKRQRIYFANHTSHIDTIALWSALPRELRDATRPVAAKDYWNHGVIKPYIAKKVLHAVLIDRLGTESHGNPLGPIIEALKQGDSLIIFPEGTRTPQHLPSPFKGGLYLLAKQFPDVELIPVYLENLYRSMPKGRLLPVPMTCTVWFGAPIALSEDEHKPDFLQRARQAIVEMA
jgi:1-acyl-sn-glycerol-3-phosphate acyltransferase